jgi:hypothetical protein
MTSDSRYRAASPSKLAAAGASLRKKASHKIDVVVAIAMAALGAVHQGQAKTEYAFIPVPSSRSIFAAKRAGVGTVEQRDAEDDAAEARSRRSWQLRCARWGRFAGY